MAAVPPPPAGPKPVLQKPPGYRDPSTPRPAVPSRPPQRRQPLPQSFRQVDARKRYGNGRPPRPRRRCRRCCCCCLLLLVLLVFALALACGASYLFFQPKLPSFHLQSLKVSRLNVTVRPDGTFLDAAASVAVQATNPNGRIGFEYKEGTTAVTAVDDEGDVGFGTDVFPRFRQGRKNSTVVRAAVGVKGVAVDDGLGSRLRSRFRSRELSFVVEVRTKVGVRVTGGAGGGGGGVWVPVRVVCGEVSLKKMEGGALPKCTLNLLRWINIY